MTKKKIALDEPKLKARDRRVVAAELERIRSGNAEGLLVPGEVVATAEDEANPLHAHFEWDDSKAGHKYRLVQANQLIRCVIPIVLHDDPEERLLPRYVSLMPDRQRVGGGYRATGEVVNSAKLLAEMEATAVRELRAWTERYQVLTGLVKKVRKAAGMKDG